MILGVCQWLAHKFGIDVAIVRVAFVLFTFLGGSGVLFYLVLYVVMKLSDDDEGYHYRNNRDW